MAPPILPKYAALLVLADNQGVSAAALARECLVTPQAMTAVLRVLDDSGTRRHTVDVAY